MKQPTARTSPIRSQRSQSSASRAAPRRSSSRTFSSTGSRSKIARVSSAAAHDAGQPGPGAAGGDVVEAAQRALGAEQRADRHRAAAERLAEADQVGLDPPAVDREQLPGAADAALDLVGAQQPPVLAAELDQRRPEAVRGRDAAARAQHRLDHDTGDLGRVEGVEEQVVADVVDGRVAAAAGARIAQRGPVGVRVRHVDEPRHQPAQPAADLRRLGAERRGQRRLAVVGAVEAEDHRPPGRAAHDLDRDLDRLGPVERDVVAGRARRGDLRAAARRARAVSSETSAWLSSLPNRAIASVTGPSSSGRPAPSGTEAEAEAQSR